MEHKNDEQWYLGKPQCWKNVLACVTEGSGDKDFELSLRFDDDGRLSPPVILAFDSIDELQSLVNGIVDLVKKLYHQKKL